MNKPMPKFNYSSYWRTWNRVLGVLPNGLIAEISLTHINGSWDSVKAENLRTHRTARAPKDIQADVLPVLTMQTMVAVLGKDKVDRLLNFDFFGQTDWEAHAVVDLGGGIPFEQVVKGAKVAHTRTIRAKVVA